jgi:hypothetical protein
MPVTQAPWNSVTLVLRTGSNSEAIANTLRNSIAGLDPDLPVSRIQTARSAVDLGLGSVSLLGSLLGAFATIGVILAVIGIYGVVSYTVVQRTGELGIRMALGAQSRDVLWLVLGKGAVLVVIGALLGAFGAYGVSKLLSSLIPSLPRGEALIAATAKPIDKLPVAAKFEDRGVECAECVDITRTINGHSHTQFRVATGGADRRGNLQRHLSVGIKDHDVVSIAVPRRN